MSDLARPTASDLCRNFTSVAKALFLWGGYGASEDAPFQIVSNLLREVLGRDTKRWF